MIKRKIAVDPERFPTEVRGVFAGANVYDSSSGDKARVYYCDTGFYVKAAVKGELKKEAELGRFFHSRGLGVEVLAYFSGEEDYLVTRSAAGEDLTHFTQAPEKLCEILAKALRLLHGQPVDGVPVSAAINSYRDWVDGDLCGRNCSDWVRLDRFPVGTKEDAWAIVQANKHRLKADTLIHGDACLPNVIVNHGKFETFLDFDMAGAGDRHMDLYWAIWSLRYNLKTEKYTDLFLDLYGRENFDPEMITVVAAFELLG